jgi:Ca-activated chloride channel family protein
VLASACAAAVTLAAAPPQTPATQAYRGVANLVSSYATVTDESGRLVTDLRREEFEVRDNGRVQPLTVFSNDLQPFTAVVMLDFSASMTANLELLKRASEQFLIRMLPQDKAQVGAFSDKIQFSGRFTNDRDDLIGALNDLQFGNPTRLYDATYQSINELKSIDGRRVVVVFTDGDDTDSKLSANDVLKSASEHETMIYAIGLESVFSIGGGRSQRTHPDRVLRKFAEDTGGGYFELKKTDELAPTFTRVALELHSQYTLGFAPAVLDNKEHKLELRMKQAGMTGRARKTYVASQDRLQ